MGNGDKSPPTFDPNAEYTPARAATTPAASAAPAFDPTAAYDTAPKQRDWLDEAADFASGLWSKVNPKAQVTGLAELTAHPLNTYVADATQRQALMDQAEKDFKNGDYAKGVARSLYGIIPFLGPQMAEAGTNIGTGKVAEGLGQSSGLGLLASSPAILKGLKTGAGSVADTLATARQSAADTFTTPKGTLTPGARAAGQVGGAATGAITGAAMGHPVIGAIEGWRSGPSLLRAMMGERTPVTPEEAFNARVAKGVESAQVREAVKKLTESPGSGVAASSSPTSPNFDTNGVIHVPEPNPASLGEQPGSMFSVPRSELLEAAQRGKPGAVDVLRSLGKPVIVIPRGASDPAGAE